MTPSAILSQVKARFPILLHDNELVLNTLLKQALAKYQELAGFTTKHRYTFDDLDSDAAVITPDGFSSRLVVKDFNGRFVPSEVWGGKLELKINGNTTFPVTLVYLESVTDRDFNTYQLPTSCVSVLSDYLEILIRIPNSERERRVSMAGKLDTSDIPTEADLNTRKLEIESQMRLSRSVLPPISLS